VTVHRGDLADGDSLRAAVAAAEPDEVYNLGGWSHVGRSWDEPETVRLVNVEGPRALLAAVEEVAPGARLVQASSSSMFGAAAPVPQAETTPFDPDSPYAQSKLEAHRLVGEARSRGAHASAAILFNHESPRRGLGFVTRKIARGAASIKLGLERELHLGDLSPRRDWGFAGDYVEGVWLMAQQSDPGDYVLGTGISHSVRDFVDVAFAHVGLDADDHVHVDHAINVRPSDAPELRADPSLAAERLGWRAKTSFEELVALMVDADLAELGS
jgi:GDPmannose 4,6-dehydratase